MKMLMLKDKTRSEIEEHNYLYMLFVENVIEVFRMKDCPDNLEIVDVKFDANLSAESAYEQMKRLHGSKSTKEILE